MGRKRKAILRSLKNLKQAFLPSALSKKRRKLESGSNSEDAEKENNPVCVTFKQLVHHFTNERKGCSISILLVNENHKKYLYGHRFNLHIQERAGITLGHASG